jgi:hypothetical protein
LGPAPCSEGKFLSKGSLLTGVELLVVNLVVLDATVPECSGFRRLQVLGFGDLSVD